MKNFRCDNICNITQAPQNLQRYCACGFIGKSAVIKYHQLLSKKTKKTKQNKTSIKEKSRFEQL